MCANGNIAGATPASGHALLHDIESLGYLAAQLAEHGQERNEPPLWIGEHYFRGDYCIVLKLNVAPRRHAGDIDVPSVAVDDELCVDPRRLRGAVVVEDTELRDFGRPDNRDQDGVLIRNVEVVKGMEVVALATGKSLKSFDDIFHGLAGRFYSVAASLEACPAVSGGEFEMAVLFAAITPNQFPGHMIQGGVQVVDSVAYYECPALGDGLSEVDAQDCLARVRIMADRQGIRVGIYEGGKLRFDVADVMIGPLDL